MKHDAQTDCLLAHLRCASLRLKLAQAEVDAVGIALRHGVISPVQAMGLLEAHDLLDVVDPSSVEVAA